MMQVLERLCDGRVFSRPSTHPSNLAAAVRTEPPRPAGDGFRDAFFPSPEFLIAVKRIQARQTFFEDEPGFGRVVFIFQLQGRKVLELDETTRYELNGPTFAALHQPEGVAKRSIWPQGNGETAVAIGFWAKQPPRILDRPIVGNPDWLAMADRPDRRFAWVQQLLSPEMERAARLVLNPTVHPTVLEAFLVTKANELLCLGIDAVLSTLPAADSSTTLQVRLGHVRRTIATNLRQPPSVAELAAATDLPVATLSSAFRRAHGVSIAEYISQQRMQEARRLLVSTRMPVKQIAYELGYNHIQNLCVAFKRQFGITTRAARRARIDAMSPQADLPSSRHP